MDLLLRTLLRSPHCIPLTERKSTGLFRTLADVTVRPSRGRTVDRHPPPQRSSHNAPVSPLSRQRSGWTTLPTGQPRNPSTRLANRPYRSDTTGLISALCPRSRWRWSFVRCSVGMEDKPAGGRAHVLTEPLRRDGWPRPNGDHCANCHSGFPTGGGTCGP